MRFICTSSGEESDGIPAFAADRPHYYFDVPEDKVEEAVFLTEDACVIAEKFFFVRGCIEIPIIGRNDYFEWGVWVSLKEENFFIWQDHFDVKQRDHVGPFFGWLATFLPGYPNTLNLKTMLHIRNDGIRPYIELEKTDHPLAIDQHEGISESRLSELINIGFESGSKADDSPR